jgi:anaerobic magnesium-protoporphyrin IX monomethyl ester cyclase
MSDNKSKKILFVVPSYEGEVQDRVTPSYYKNPVVKYMPLGVLSLAAVIKNDHDVFILDASSRGLTLDETIEEIERIQPEILALSVVTYRAWQMIQILDRTSAPIKIVGGPHTTVNYDVVKRQGVHAVFVGDGEEILPKWLDDGCPEGIFHGQQVNMDTIPFPARELVSMEDYRIVPNKDLLFDAGSLRLPMFSSKGCPYKCIYCDVQQKVFNWKSPERCSEEMLELRNLGATSVHILDDCFNINKVRVKSMTDNFIENGINEMDWSVRGSVEVHDEVIKGLSDAGCKRYHVGMEHLDPKVLKTFKKPHTIEMTIKFCQLCSDYDLPILAYLIMGAPGETDEYRKKLPDIIRELDIAHPYFNVLSPLNETPYYEQLLKSKVFKKDHWAEFIENPVKDFPMPSGRSEAEDDELAIVVDGLIEEFNAKPSTESHMIKDEVAA